MEISLAGEMTGEITSPLLSKTRRTPWLALPKVGSPSHSRKEGGESGVS